MNQPTANAVACTIVGSKLDYCNVFLASMSGSNLDNSQRVQNYLDRFTPFKPHQNSYYRIALASHLDKNQLQECDTHSQSQNQLPAT